MTEMRDHECSDTKCCHCGKTMYLHEGRRPVTLAGTKHWVCWPCYDEHYAGQRLPWIKYP